MLGTIKVDKRMLFSNETLHDLLLLNSDKLPLEKFNLNPGIDLWWVRRPLQKARKQYMPCCKPSTSQATNSEDSESEVEKMYFMTGMT